jgi:hypothetical protein
MGSGWMVSERRTGGVARLGTSNAGNHQMAAWADLSLEVGYAPLAAIGGGTGPLQQNQSLTGSGALGHLHCHPAARQAPCGARVVTSSPASAKRDCPQLP